MTGAVNTQASEFPEDGPLPVIEDASEFRDIDLTDLVPGKSTEYASALNEQMAKPVDARGIAVEGRRVYAAGPEAQVATVTSSDGARSYSSRSVYCAAGTAGYAGPAVLLLGDDVTRNRIVLSNSHDTQAVLIGPLNQVANGAGFALLPGAYFESTVTDQLYAAVPIAGTDPVNVGVWAEYA
jgi:hypothetical protein